MSTTKEEILTALAAAQTNVNAIDALVRTLPDPTPPPPPPEPTPTETVIKVGAGDDLQKAFEAAAIDKSGLDVRIRVRPATGYKSTNNFFWPAKTHNKNIFVEADWDNDANLGSGRVDPGRNDLPT